MRVVVTGTDTGVGKTYVSAALRPSVYVKAAQTGDDDDAATVRALCGASVHTLAWYPEPLAPETAARRAGVRVHHAGRDRGVRLASSTTWWSRAPAACWCASAGGRSRTSPRCSTRR